MGKIASFIGFVIYLIFGLYLISYPFNFLTPPNFILSIEKWIIFIAGILVMVGGINYLRAGKEQKVVSPQQ